MPVCIPRYTQSTAPVDRPFTRPGTVLGQPLKRAQLSAAPAPLVRHSSWPEMETAPMKNWQVELAEQHQRRMSMRTQPETFEADDQEMMSDDEDDQDYIDVYQGHQWSASSSPLTDPDAEMGADAAYHDGHLYQRGAFTPVFEEDSPVLIRDHDASSSPIGPITPFGDFVDRAVAVSVSDGYEAYPPNPAQDYDYAASPLHPLDLSPSPDVAKEASPPCASAEYKKMAVPMSEFIAQYVWKACTTGMSLPAVYSRQFSGGYEQAASEPPSYLAPAIYSMLLSTLLQPSAIALAIWYIVRLPIYFDGAAFGPEYAREYNFRAELFGDGNAALQVTAPFRLVILGCILSNKWLDDHTFSNRTWQTISNLPIHSLNTLESLALDIFSYDLSTPSEQWAQWLDHLLAYHQSTMAPGRIQPISRPSNNPQAIVRNTFEEVWTATRELPVDRPEAVFIGYEQRKAESIKTQQKRDQRELARQAIDLDVDGPIREEYLPRRKSSSHVPVKRDALQFATLAPTENRKMSLPPPAKWSPAADEPILRRSSGSYVAVQPPLCTVPKWYHDFVTHGAYFAPTQPPSVAYPYEQYIQPQQSIVLSQPVQLSDMCQPAGHACSYSQAQAGLVYRCSNVRMTSNDNIENNAENGVGAWTAQPQPYMGHSRLPFGAAPHVNYQPTWLKA